MSTQAQPGSIAEGLQRGYEAWFVRLQALAPHQLEPDDWTGRWFDGYTPEEALAVGPDWD